MFIAEEYLEGKRAYRDGWAFDECPYQPGTAEFTDWCDGWEDAEGESSLGM